MFHHLTHLELTMVAIAGLYAVAPPSYLHKHKKSAIVCPIQT